MTPARLSEFTAARTVAETAAQSVISNAASEETTLVARALLDAYGIVDALLDENAALRTTLVLTSASMGRLQMRVGMIKENIDEGLRVGQ